MKITTFELKNSNSMPPEKAKRLFKANSRPLLLKKVIWFSMMMIVGTFVLNAAPWTLSDERINQLLAGDVCQAIGLKEWTIDRKRLGVKNWSKSEEVFIWPVKASTNGSCEVTLLVNTPKAGTVLILSSNEDSVEMESPERGWQRLPTILKVGKDDTIKLKLKESLANGKEAASIIGLEIITAEHISTHKKRLVELRTPVKDVKAFCNAGFGIMFQWGNWGYPRTGERKEPWNKVYEDFDIEAFADKMKSFNPGYIIWSITWRGSRFSAPLNSVDKIMGSKEFTMEYDFLGKLTDALTKRGMPVYLYYHPGAEEPEYWKKVWHGYGKVKFWEEANIAIWTEVGERLGKNLSGWFIDDGIVQYYGTGPDFYRYVKALKAGNPKRLVSFNPWIMPNCTPYEDMTMGEGHCPGKIEDGRLATGPNKGLMPHTMTIMDGPDWGIWQKSSTINKPSGDLKSWQERVYNAIEEKHPLSLCILMYEDGSISESTESILRQLKRSKRSGSGAEWLGATLEDVELNFEAAGVEFVNVSMGSAIAEAGIREKDLIQMVNGTKLSSLKEFFMALSATKSASVRLTVLRGENVREMLVKRQSIEEIEAVNDVGEFKRLPLPTPSRKTVVTNHPVTNDPLSSLTDSRLGQGFGPVFKNGIVDGMYKMDLGAAKPVLAISSWSYNQGGVRGRQKIAIYGSSSATDPGWDLANFTKLGSLDTGRAHAEYTAASLAAPEGMTLGTQRWIIWATSTISDRRECTAFQELNVTVAE